MAKHGNSRGILPRMGCGIHLVPTPEFVVPVTVRIVASKFGFCEVAP